jgi:flagellar hook-associated protein 2
MASTSSVDLSVSGLASGFDWKSVVSQLAQAERAPEAVWARNQSKINAKNSAFTIVSSYLNQLQTAAKALKDPTIYDNRSAMSSTPANATATADAGARMGAYNFNFTQLATVAALNGTANAGAHLNATNDVSSVTVGTANFANAVTAGKFTVNGAQITIVTTDSLKTVFDNISAATGGAVTASYDSTTDKISLNSASAITLGSAADTSNFLQSAKLYNNGTGTSASADTLGRVQVSSVLASTKLATTISDGGSGAGAFSVNGVAISFNAATDTLQGVMDKINSSGAGVTASYDVVNNKFSLVNNKTGNVGISLADTTGNFLAATGLAGGALTAGKDLKYTVNGGATLVSQSNTIDSSSSGITGLSVTALAENTAATITVGTDASGIATQVQNFVSAYNNVQSYITTNAATTTDSSGKTVGGTLTGDVDAANLANTLRTSAFSPVSITGLSATFSQLAALGIKTNGKDNSVTLDSTALNSALAGNLSDIKKLFSDSANGIAAKLDSYVTNMTGDSGTITSHKAVLAKQTTSIDTQVTNLEKQITTDSAHWTKAFQAMETAQAQLNQELSYLTKNFK